ncbi:MAG: DUF401 family protein [Faecousia sp.]
MVLVKLAMIFLAIILLLALKRPLWQALLGGLAATVLLYGIAPLNIVKLTGKVITGWSSLQVLICLYLITFLQRILESRGQIRLAQEDLNRLFHNRRINIIGACLFIGLLPSAASMLLCAELVKNATDGYLDSREQAFVSSWFRHIPESCLPTYTAVLLMLNLSGVETAKFMVGMIVPALFLGCMGYFIYLRRVPTTVDTPAGTKRLADLGHLFCHLWSLILILVLILCFHFQVVTAVLVSIVLSFFIYRVSAEEFKKYVFSAFEKKMIGNTFLVLVLKEFLSFTGILPQLPDILAKLPLPTYLIFGLLFFLATIISGSTAAIAMGTPLAFAAIPGGAPLMIYLMCMSHAASQLSPTHVCLVVASDYFHIPLGDLVRKTLPFSIAFCVFITIYYNILLLL